MAFTRRVAPAKVGRVTVTLSQELDADGELLPIVAGVEFVPVAADGKRIPGDVRSFDLWDQLAAAQRTAVTNLLASLRTRGDAEVI